MNTRYLLATLGVTLAASSLAAEERGCMFGADSMRFPDKVASPTDLGDRRSSWEPNADVRAHMGSDFPFRDGVQFGMFDMGANFSVSDGTVYASPVDWDNIGYFIKRIDNAGQCALVLSVIHQDWPLTGRAAAFQWPVWQKERLTGASVRSIFHEIETKAKDLPLKIITRDFDENLMTGECYSKDGRWFTCFSLIDDESLIEYKYVIDQHNRIARRARVLVAGPTRQQLGPLPEDGGHKRFAICNDWPFETPEKALARRCACFLRAAAYLSTWRKDLGSPDATTRQRAFFAIRCLDEAALDAVPELLKVMNRPDNLPPSDSAGMVFCDIGAAAIPALRKAMKDPDRQIRENAVEAYCFVGKGAPEDMPVLEGIIRAIEDLRTRSTALARLLKIDPAASTFPIARNFLADSNPEIRCRAISLLARIGPAAKDAIPELRKRLASPEWNESYAAIWAIGSIGPGAEDAAVDLQRLLKSDLTTTRLAAAIALGRIGHPPKAALSDLRTLVTSDNINFRAEAIEAIGYIAPADTAVVNELRAALKDRDWSVRAAAAEALGRIGPPAKDAVPDLRAAVRSPYREVCRAAVIALGRTGPAAKDAIPELQQAQKQGGDIRDAAIEAIKAIEH